MGRTARFPTGTTFTTTEEFGPIAAADLNGDGKQDLIVESSQKGLVEVLLGDGQGGFGIPQVYFVGPGGNDAIGVAIGDVNGDGILDIVTPGPRQFSSAKETGLSRILSDSQEMRNGGT